MNNIGHILRTLGRNWGHLADIWDSWQTYGTVDRHMGQLADIWDIWQTLWALGRHWGNWGHWAEIGQTLSRYWGNIEVSIFLCKIRLFGFLIQRSRSKSKKSGNGILENSYCSVPHRSEATRPLHPRQLVASNCKDGGTWENWGAPAHPDVDRSVNPNPTRWSRLRPPHYYSPSQIFRPFAIPGK